MSNQETNKQQQPPAEESKKPYHDDSTVIWLDTIESEPVKWLWQDRIARGKITLLCGEPGVSKSMFALDIAARISSDRDWPDYRGSPDVGSVLIFTAEDDSKDTIKPRLEMVKANPDKIAHVKCTFDMTSENTGVIPKAINQMKTQQDIRLIILDPITEYLGNVDSHKNAEVRSVLSRLAEFATEYDVAVLGITHYAKAENKCVDNRIIGSMAFNACARNVWHVLKDKNRRLFVAGKHNLVCDEDATGLAYTVESGETKWVTQTGKKVTIGKVDIGSEPVLESAQNVADRLSRSVSKAEIASDFLLKLLEDGPVDGDKVKNMAAQAGISDASLRSGKKNLGIESPYVGQNKTKWNLPDFLDRSLDKKT